MSEMTLTMNPAMASGQSPEDELANGSSIDQRSKSMRDHPPSSIDVKRATKTESSTPFSSFDDCENGIAPVVQKQRLGAHSLEDAQLNKGPVGGPLSITPSVSPLKVSVAPIDVAVVPKKKQGPAWRRLRHNVLAVYQRLFSLTLIANLVAWTIVLVTGFEGNNSGPANSSLATAAAANVTVAILIRQEYVINALYTPFCWTPHAWPLVIRRRVAKFYEFGGVHSGCGAGSVIWSITFAAFITRDFAKEESKESVVTAVTYILLSLFTAICIFAIPQFRFISHNTFEIVHRFAGWLSVGLFWVEILLVFHAQAKASGSESYGMLVVKAPAFWFLIVITLFVVLPWIRLRKVIAVPEVLSNHATRIHFDYTRVAPILGIRLATNPLKEWHAFATIPAPDGKSFSVIVSNAGDWTKQQIQHPRQKYWVRGIPVSGVLRMATVFKRVLVVTTGAGIGPCLSMLIARPMPCRVLWSTANPSQTYGTKVMDAVYEADPNALVIDIRISGRPDMVALAYHLYVESQSEAVFVISNTALTKKVVYGMESRGIPAYGPIWDS